MRIRRLLLCAGLSMLLALSALAADPGAMWDIQGHWCQSDAEYVVQKGLFAGTSETEFSPENEMTRGMFVTVMGRMAGINPEDYRNWYLSSLYTDVDPDSYYAPYVSWASQKGIVLGCGDGTFAPDLPVTREQMGVIVIRFVDYCGYTLPFTEDPVSFADQWAISDYAGYALEVLQRSGILQGSWDEFGNCWMNPQSAATRGACACVIARLDWNMRTQTDRIWNPPTDIALSQDSAALETGDILYLTADVVPADADNLTVTWFSTDRSVADVAGGTIWANGAGTCQICALNASGQLAACSITVEEPLPAAGLAYAGESYQDKCIRIFGQRVSDPRNYYALSDTSYLEKITVQVWDFADASHTIKVTKTCSLTVHRNIADTVKAIFEEIYNGPERFPINSAGCYRAEASSEHNPGLAIDINPDANYMIRGGTVVSGSHWTPDTDPYSIPLDGDVARAFTKYGFFRGFWNSGKDYMHFSFFGT